ncbi:hypothetical protein TFLX_00728 [Thermoflexales bacterium]|nr:hypothetical protein TFLX_00728 [Thermoflexales bacterium]
MFSPSFTDRLRKISLALLPTVIALLALAAARPQSPAVAQQATQPEPPAAIRTYPGAAPCDTTLQACIAGAFPGDVINILPGTYHETIDLNKRVNLIGAGPGQTTLRPSSGRVMSVTNSGIDSSIVISGLTIAGGRLSGSHCPTHCGGGVGLFNKAQPQFVNVVFSDNVAYQGGGLYADLNTPITLTNVSFISNTATQLGGGAYGQAGAFVTDGFVERNQARWGGGLAILNQSIKIVGTRFADNRAVGRAGALYVQGALSSTISQAEFTSNYIVTGTGSEGGAAYLSSPTLIENSRFENNRTETSSGLAGALYVYGAMTINHTDFISNSAGSSAGAVYQNGGPAALANVQFISNTAWRGGGGSLFMISSHPASLTNARFENNRAMVLGGSGGAGGGLYATSRTQLLIVNTDFIGNSAPGIGGGAYIDAPTLLSHVRLIQNTSVAGGGMALWDRAAFDHVEVLSNTATTSAGGGIQSVDALTATNSLFQGNQSLSGGGLATTGRLTLIDTDFIGNTATNSNGGGASANNRADIIGGRFAGNRCTGTSCFGGGLYAGTTATVTGVIVENNFAGNTGGGLAAAGNLVLNDSTFISNTSGSGGALYKSGTGNGRIVNNLFARNTATTGGAALQLAAGQVVVLHNTIVDSGLNAKPAIQIENGTVGITNTIVMSHAVGLKRNNGTVRADYNLFSGNTANFNGTVIDGGHNVSGDPRFVDPAADNYRIRGTSAALDVASDAEVTTDLDGNVRPQGNGYDIGAYESTIADLLLTKSAPTRADLDEPFAYTLVVTNAGPSVGNEVILTDVLPAEVSLISTSAGCTGTTIITCDFEVLPVGATAEATIVVSPTAIGPITNVASVTAREMIRLAVPPTTASATTRIVDRDPTTIALISDPNPAILAQTVVITAQVTPVAATGAIVFKDNDTVLAEVPLANGVATLTTADLTYGPHTLTAQYGGDDNYKPGVSPVMTQVIDLPAQGHRDFGPVRVWADSFVLGFNNLIEATGRVMVGPQALGDNGKYFSVGGAVRGISGTNAITLTGQLAFLQGGQPLVGGSYTATNGQVNLFNASVAITKLGKSDIFITPSLVLDLLKPEVDAQAAIEIALPETQTLQTLLAFKVGPHDVLTATLSHTLSLKFAGGTLTGTFSAGTEGINIKAARLDIPYIPTLMLSDLVIDGKGPAKLRFKAAAETHLPDFSVFDDFFQVKGITITVGVDFNSAGGTSFAADLKVQQMRLMSLPFNSGVTIGGGSPINLKLAKGGLSGQLPTFTMTAAGREMTFKGVTFGKFKQPAAVSNGFDLLSATALFTEEYHIAAERTEFKVPKSWVKKATNVNLTPYFLLEDTYITKREPYIHIGAVGGKIVINEPFYLAGDPDATAAVKFDQIVGELVYHVADERLVFQLDARVTFQLGSDWSTAAGVRLYIDNNGISGTLRSVNLTLAGIALQAEDLKYENDTFHAMTTTLTLPASWGGERLTVNNLSISADGVTWGDASGQFKIPNKELWLLHFSDNTAAIAVTAEKQYMIRITTTLTIKGAEDLQTGNNVSTRGSLWIKNGKIDGSINGFGFRLGGFEFQVQEPKFVEGLVSAQQVGLKLPDSLGGVGTTLYGLEIGGPNGFNLTGGKFHIPDFTAFGVGVRNVLAELYRQPDGNYSIRANAQFGFEAFAVEGGFKMLYIKQPPEVRLQQVRLAFEGRVSNGTAIPIGDTGLFLTRVAGEFDLSSGVAEMRFGVRVTGGLDFFGIPWIAADGEVALKVRPFDLVTSATTRLLGIRVNEAVIHMTSRSVSFTGTSEWQVARAILSLAFGFDPEGEFTAYGQSVMEVGLRKGSIGCVLWVCIPPATITLERKTYDAGKFYHDGKKVWGARAAYTLFGKTFYVFVKVAPGLGLDAGLNMEAYEPVPIGLLRTDGADASAAATSAYRVNVSGAASELWIAEAITPTNRPSSQPIAITAPNGAAFTTEIVYEPDTQDQRIYVITLANPAQAIGPWTINAQPGNVIGVWGADPAPQIGTFNVTTPQGALLPIEQQPTPRFTFNGNEAFNVTWNVSNNDPGFSVEVYAVDAQGVRYPIANQKATQAQLAGNTTWTPALASGTYTLTIAVDDYKHTPIVARTEPIIVNDTTPPAAPIGLIAAPRGDGSVLLTWNGSAAEADVAGYRVSIDGATPQIKAGRLNQFDVYGLAPDSVHQFAVSAYDLSGNVGPAAFANAAMPTNGLVSQTPRRDEMIDGVSEVSFTFAKPISLTVFTLQNEQGMNVTGALTPITSQVSVDQVDTLGARFTPGAVLQSGHYTATVAVQDMLTGQTLTESWSFTLLAPVYHVYLPVVTR